MAHNYVLEQVDIFEDLSAAQLDRIEESCEEKGFNEGEVYLRKIRPAESSSLSLMVK